MRSKKKLIIITVIVAVLLCATVAVLVLTKGKPGKAHNTIVESVAEPEAGEEPAEFRDEPDIIIPSAQEDVETMVTQDSGEIDLEDGQGGSF